MTTALSSPRSLASYARALAALAVALATPLVGGQLAFGAMAQDPVAVEIRDSAFEPQTITVPQGATVTWAHAGTLRHTVTADDAAFDSGILIGGGTFSRTFETPGTFGYHCALHGGVGSGMFGTVVVTPPAAAVVVKDNLFEPQTITVTQGSTIAWTNGGARPHTVTADDGAFDSGTLGGGQGFTLKLDTVGMVRYHCAFHGGAASGMFGTIEVVAAVPATPAATDQPAAASATAPPAAAPTSSEGVPTAPPAAPQPSPTSGYSY